MGQKRKENAKHALFSVGDVIKTKPFETGYWGCALVLSSREKTVEFHPQCHIAITDFIAQHDYGMSDLKLDRLKILRSDRVVRTAPFQSVVTDRGIPCIGIYSRRIPDCVECLGRIDITSIDHPPLTFVVGDGTGSGWPLCGGVEQSLGYQAVHAWRRIHDYARWKQDIEAAEKSHEDMLVRLEGERKAKRNAKTQA